MATTDRPAGFGGLVVRIAESQLFIPVGFAIEVVRDAAIVQVPGAGMAVRGVVNHRGRVLTVADAAVALGLAGTPASGREIVILQVGDRRFGLAVGAVVELLAEARTGLAEVDLEQIAAAVFA